VTTPVIDCNVRIGKSAYGESFTITECLKRMDENGIELSIISSFTPIDLSFEKSNRAIELSVVSNPVRFTGAARVDPRSAESSSILKKYLRKRSFASIYLNPFEQAFKVNGGLASKIYEIAEHTNSTVIIESGYPIVSLPLQVAEIAREFKKVRFVMTHAGQLLASGQSEGDSFAALIENKNIYCDTSQVILTGIGGFIEQAVKSGAGKRVLFGSNSPSGNLSVELMRVCEANISERDKTRILCENAKEIFDV
jgi:uncharacterized protein